MYTYDDLGFLWFLLVGTLGAHLLTIGVNGLLTYFIGLDDRRCQQLKQAGGERFTTGWIANNQR